MKITLEEYRERASELLGEVYGITSFGKDEDVIEDYYRFKKDVEDCVDELATFYEPDDISEDESEIELLDDDLPPDDYVDDLGEMDIDY